VSGESAVSTAKLQLLGNKYYVYGKLCLYTHVSMMFPIFRFFSKKWRHMPAREVGYPGVEGGGGKRRGWDFLQLLGGG